MDAKGREKQEVMPGVVGLRLLWCALLLYVVGSGCGPAPARGQWSNPNTNADASVFSVMVDTNDVVQTPTNVTIRHNLTVSNDLAVLGDVSLGNATGDTVTVAGGLTATGAIIGATVRATKLLDSDLDATVGSPSDGKIMVWRSAGSDWVLEDKPIGGSNPALNDVTDVSLGSLSVDEALVYNGSVWTNAAQSGSGLSDGDKGDITVSGSGATWNLDAGVVDTAELAADAVTAAELDETGNYTMADLTITGTLSATQSTMSVSNVVLQVLDASGADDIDIGSGDVTDVTVVTDGGTIVLDGADSSGIPAGAIDSGDIAAARMTANAPVASDFTGDGDFLVGTGAGTFTAESGATVRTSLGLAIGTDVLAPDGDGSSLTSVDAATGDSATSFFDAGTLEIARLPTTGYSLGTSTATTPSAEDDDTSLATTAYVQTELENEILTETITILEPDQVQGESDDLVLFKAIAEAHPNGITITSIHIDASAAYTSETFLFEHWDDASGTTQATIESIAASSISTEDDGTLTDATVPADYFVVLNFDDTPEDISYVNITIGYYDTAP